MSSENNVKKQFKRLLDTGEEEEEETAYGLCLFTAFSIGEWADKAYHFAEQGNWVLARNWAANIGGELDKLAKYCGVNVRKPSATLGRLIKAIIDKNFPLVKQHTEKFDEEILHALRTAKE